MARRRNSTSYYDSNRYSNYYRNRYIDNYANSYENKKRIEDFEKFLATIGIAIFSVLVLFFKKIHGRKLWKEFFISTAVLLATGFLCLAIASKTTPDVFTWGIIVSFIVYCVYWIAK